MSLTACPICGYAVSTTTSQCRHCSATPRAGIQFKSLSPVQSMQTAALIATVGFAIYLIFFR